MSCVNGSAKAKAFSNNSILTYTQEGLIFHEVICVFAVTVKKKLKRVRKRDQVLYSIQFCDLDLDLGRKLLVLSYIQLFVCGLKLYINCYCLIMMI